MIVGDKSTKNVTNGIVRFRDFFTFAGSHCKPILCDEMRNETYLIDYLLYRGHGGLIER